MPEEEVADLAVG